MAECSFILFYLYQKISVTMKMKRGLLHTARRAMIMKPKNVYKMSPEDIQQWLHQLDCKKISENFVNGLLMVHCCGGLSHECLQLQGFETELGKELFFADLK